MTIVSERKTAVRFLICQIFTIFILLCLSISSAQAQEVPVGTTTVRIPIVLPAEAAIAGGEIGFTQTTGLEYRRFVPATGVENPVKATVGDTTYVGFFSTGNSYQPANGGLAMGSLEFTYNGNSAEQVVLQEIRLHTKVTEGVNTQTLSPGTVYSVTRASSDTGGGSGDGSGDSGDDSGGTDNSSNSGSGGTGGGSGGAGNGSSSGASGTGSTGSAGGTGSSSWNTTAKNNGTGTVDEQENLVVELAPDPSASTGTPSGTNTAPDNTDGAILGDATTPLVATPSTSNEVRPALWWFLGAAALLALAVLAFVILKRRRRRSLENHVN